MIAGVTNCSVFVLTQLTQRPAEHRRRGWRVLVSFRCGAGKSTRLGRLGVSQPLANDRRQNGAHFAAGRTGMADRLCGPTSGNQVAKSPVTFPRSFESTAMQPTRLCPLGHGRRVLVGRAEPVEVGRQDTDLGGVAAGALAEDVLLYKRLETETCATPCAHTGAKSNQIRPSGGPLVISWAQEKTRDFPGKRGLC